MSTLGTILLTACLLHAGSDGSSEWTIVESHPLPEGASGLAWDGTHLYCGIYGVNGGHIYRIDPETGSHELLFQGVHEDAFGLTFDGTHLWTTDHPGSSSTPAQAMKLGWNGDVLEQIALPDHYMSGIAWDDGEFLVSRYYPDPGHVYRLDADGHVLAQFDCPDDQPWDLAVQDGDIWIADYWGDTLYRVDADNGTVITSHAAEDVDPAGIVWDGQYLWYCDNGGSNTGDLLYKVDLQGSGSSEILVQDPVHAFGTVAIGATAVWNVDVANTGTADLVVSGVTFDPGSDLRCTADLPLVLPPGGSDLLPIEFTPDTFGPIDVAAMILSNDPITPEAELLITGHGVHPDPTIAIADASHDFGAVRIGAHTRWFIDIANHGAQVLSIADIASDNVRFSVETGTQLPIDLQTLESIRIGVWFNPVEVPQALATITISSNDPDHDPALVMLAGSGEQADRPMGTTLWSHLIEGGWDNSPKAMAHINDITGDGREDLIVCSEDYMVRCMNGNADGSGDVLWEHEIYSGSIYSGKGLDVVEDIDGDGYEDLVVGATGGARLIRMLSGADGLELWSYETDVVGDGGWVYQVDGSRDFNGDGMIDVLACAGDDGSDSGPRRAYCIDGTTGSLLWQRPLGGPVFAIIAVDDFTGDGVPDAVAGGSNAMRNQGSAFGIDGTNGSQVWSYTVAGSSVWALAAIGDVSGDGITDVMVGDFSTGQYHGLDVVDGSALYQGSGLGTLTGFKRVEDVNGDGHPEVVPEHFSNFVPLLSGLDGSYLWSRSVSDKPAVASSIPDVSGDGINDIVVGTLFSNNDTYFLDGADGVVLHTADLGSPVDAITVIPDVVGDGSWELVAGGRDGRVVCLSGGLDALVLDPADFNQDGVVDGFDLTVLLSEWGSMGSFADLTEDGIVDGADLTVLLAAWTF